MARLNEAPTFLPTSFFLLPRCDCCVPGLAMDSGWASDTSSFDLPWPAQPVNIGHRRGASSSSARTSSSVPLSAATQPIPTPRTHVTTACERCRKLKARCDGDGPPCGRCATLRIPTVGRFHETQSGREFIVYCSTNSNASTPIRATEEHAPTLSTSIISRTTSSWLKSELRRQRSDARR